MHARDRAVRRHFRPSVPRRTTPSICTNLTFRKRQAHQGGVAPRCNERGAHGSDLGRRRNAGWRRLRSFGPFADGNGRSCQPSPVRLTVVVFGRQPAPRVPRAVLGGAARGNHTAKTTLVGSAERTRAQNIPLKGRSDARGSGRNLACKSP